MNRIGVETAQHVEVNYEPASVVERILAYLIDICVLGAYLIALSILGEGSDNGGDIQWMNILFIALPAWLYFLVLEIVWNGYTIGKWATGIRVVKLDGSRPDIFNYLIRWFIRLFEVTMTSGGLALLVILLNGKGQRLGDMAAKTCVIKVKRKTRLSDTLFEKSEGEFEIAYPQVVELSDRDMSVVLEVLDSFGQYDDRAWRKLAERTQHTIEKRLQINAKESTPREFLNRLKLDYNRVHGHSDQ